MISIKKFNFICFETFLKTIKKKKGALQKPLIILIHSRKNGASKQTYMIIYST